MSMKKSNDTIGNRTRDLLVCSFVPQPSPPPRSPLRGNRPLKKHPVDSWEINSDNIICHWSRTLTKSENELQIAVCELCKKGQTDCRKSTDKAKIKV
jgi:hypothetical protein